MPGRLRPTLLVGVMLLCLQLAAPAAHATQDAGTVFDPTRFAPQLTRIASGFAEPLFVTTPPGDTERLFIVERPGLIKIVPRNDPGAEPRVFLDLTRVVDLNGVERGLLGLAFHPDYARNGYFFVSWTGVKTNVVARYTVSANPDLADPASRMNIIVLADPHPIHNGGMLAFGPDGYLYTSFGDGGPGADPQGNGQKMSTLHGKILRLDIDVPVGLKVRYQIPPDNPFAGRPGTRPEIWASGLRNPWRFSFDRQTGDLYIADVGQERYEELNFQLSSSRGGENYGWVITEGNHCFPERQDCDTSGITMPIVEYGRDLGRAITGGYVYRGRDFPELRRIYFFADFTNGKLWGVARDASGEWQQSAPIETGLTITSFGEDADGEIYVTAYDGGLYRLTR